jgi:hypothetical protein
MSGKDARHMWFDTLLNMVLTLSPRLVIAARAAIEMRAPTNAYSIAVAAFSQRRIFINRIIPLLG